MSKASTAQPWTWAAALSRAVATASHLLVSKFDRSGQPYILHPLWIMNQVIHLGLDYAILAIWHDCAEDCFDTVEEGLEYFRLNVIDDTELINDLSLLSHRPNVSYAEYIRGIRPSIRATAIKLKDLEHNSTVTRLKGLSDKDTARTRKYHASFAYLSGDEGKLMDLYI